MDIQIDRQQLIGMLRFITPITDSSTPILNNFVFEASEDEKEALCAATNYEMTVQMRLPVDVVQSGTFCLHAKRLLEFCNRLSTEQVTMTSNENMWVQVSSGRSQLQLPSVERSLYPDLPRSLSEEGSVEGVIAEFEMGTEDLLSAIKKTAFAAQVNETRKALMGVNLRLDDQAQVCWTATDGHRLAQIKQTVDVRAKDDEKQLNAIVPRQAFEEMRRILEGGGDTVLLRLTERVLYMQLDHIEFSTLLVEASFPNVESVIPSEEENPKNLQVNQRRFAEALKITAQVIDNKVKPIKLELSKGNLKIESERQEYANAQSELEAGYEEDDNFEIGFNAVYLDEVMDVMGGADQVFFHFKEALKPCLINSPQLPQFVAVVMPLRLEW